MNIHELVSTEERERILRRLLYYSAPISLHRMARDAGVSPSQVHKYISIWKRMGLIEERIPKDHPLVRGLRITENVLFLENTKFVGMVRNYIKGVLGVGLYGSWAKGTNNETADVDIWILSEQNIDDLTIGRLRKALETKLQKKFDMTVLTNERLKELKDKNPNFYYSLYHSITLWGKNIW